MIDSKIFYLKVILQENINNENSNHISKVLLFGNFEEDDVEKILLEVNEEGMIFFYLKFIFFRGRFRKKR